jgi:glycosyltransferase involved in cell wall biosynthesis
MTKLPILEDLPAAPAGKTGWPWTEGSKPLPKKMPDGSEWLKISIVTPSYNQGQFIEETIRSVLLQGYPNLEYIIIDGESTDNTIDIIKQYESWITYWVREKDGGQSDAINKGFQKITGEITNWLCSDDILAKDALSKISAVFLREPSISIAVGKTNQIYEDDAGKIINIHTDVGPRDLLDIQLMPATQFIPQPSTFYRSNCLDRVPALIESYNYAMDFELWNYFVSKGKQWGLIEEILSTMRHHHASKTTISHEKMAQECEAIYKQYSNELIPLTFFYKKIRLPLIRLSSNIRWPILNYLIKLVQIIYIIILSPFYGMNKVRRMYLNL